MALDDIIYPEDGAGASTGVLNEIVASSFTGAVSDIVFEKDDAIEELILVPGGGGATSWVF